MGKIITKEQWDSLPRIIAVDFDGTLVKDSIRGIGKPNRLVFDYVKMLREVGWRAVLWTCRDNDNEDAELDAAIAFCKDLGLEFDAVNDNVPEVKALYGDPRKIHANIYLDDRAREVRL